MDRGTGFLEFFGKNDKKMDIFLKTLGEESVRKTNMFSVDKSHLFCQTG